MNTPTPPVQARIASTITPRQKVRPFSFTWGVIFLAVGSMGFASGTFGLRPGPVLSATFVVASCVVLYLVLANRRLITAGHTPVAAGATNLTPSATAPTAGHATSPEDELYQQALAELDSVDYTVATPEQVLNNDALDQDDATGSEEAG